jgi:hypothetical protein
MPLKAVIEDIDELDEPLRALYVEQDGKFVLDVDETVEELPRISNLRNAYKREQEARKGASEKLKKLEARVASLPEDFDPTEIAALREQAAKAGGDGKAAQEHAAKIREQLEKRFMADLEAERQKSGQLMTRLERMIVDGGLDKAMDAAGISPKFKAAARALLKERGIVKLSDDRDEAMVETDMGPTPVLQFVRDWAASDEGRPFVEAPVGAGANGASRGKFGEPNPYTKAHWNKTAQAQMLRGDRAKAERLARAAGFANIEAANRAREALS